MSIDERIEALTHNVELLSQMHQDNEKTYQTRFMQVLDAISKLTTVAQSHEQRLSDLEDRR